MLIHTRLLKSPILLNALYTTCVDLFTANVRSSATVPAQQKVVNKERASGAYRLSAYYLARMFGELPLLMVPPTLYFVISYPMMGCSSIVTFVQLLLFLLLNSVVAEVSKNVISRSERLVVVVALWSELIFTRLPLVLFNLNQSYAALNTRRQV